MKYLSSNPLVLPMSVAFFSCSVCGVSGQTYRVCYDPYGGVNWKTAHRCLSQHHDHVRDSEDRIRSYDAAGYHAVSVMHYSGVASLGYPWSERHWPLSDWLPNYDSDNEFLATCENLKILIPNAEEIGDDHITSPFLTTYIALWEPNYYEQREPWHYDDSQGSIDLINGFGGLAFMAHPWRSPISYYLQFENIAGIEVYSGFAAYNFLHGHWSWDRNVRHREVWDMLLSQKSTRIWGIAVNDWFGPFWEDRGLYPDVADSGKTVVMIADWTLEAYQRSIEAGAFFAITDFGETKGLYAVVADITVTTSAIEITTGGDVVWLANGVVLASGPVLDLGTLPAGLVYVRAEVSNEFGTLYCQPFSLAVGLPNDVDEDGDIDLLDFAGFQNCFRTSHSATAERCSCAHDTDWDGGIDLDDFVQFDGSSSGPKP